MQQRRQETEMNDELIVQHPKRHIRLGKTAAEAVMSQKPYVATVDVGQQCRSKYSREL